MLAQNFKTPADLKISNAEFDALYKVLGMLERDELVHRPDNPHRVTIPNAFSMGHWGTQTDCGSIGCIRGWAIFVSKDDTVFAGTSPRNVERLFTVDHIHMQDRTWADIRPDQAAIALRNFLTHGEARWAEALAA